ncbi:MAG: toll/interleukin-1 receptor domain-containing protein [Deltaproteobacteria bacterium]|nr:toll/interleukin-1 receptor domain-containing protein [Deltaproteobacteria bacterium]
MPSESSYKYDIFISYCHRDNSRIGEKPGWVDTFYEFLENWLRDRRGLSNLKIWRDESRMGGNTDFTDAIKDAINNSALFFALHSSKYPESDYCQKELGWFHEYNSKRPGGLRVGNGLRIFNILLNNTPHKQWSDALGKTIGFPMHDSKSDDDPGEFTSPSVYQFEVQLRKIVDAAQKILKEIKPETVVTPTTSEKAQRVQVFVADVADSLQDFRERVITEAKEKEAYVFDEIPPPMESDNHAEKVKEVQSHSQLSIHLLDKWPGRKIRDNRETSYSKEQLQIALKSGSRKLIWVPGDLNIESIEDQNQKELLETIANGEREKTEYEFVHGPFTDFLASISQKIDDLRAPLQNGAAPMTFLIDTHQKDQRYAYKLADCLADQNIDVEFNKESHDPNISLTEFENSVKKAENLIIVFGKVGKEWLEARIKKVFKTISEQLEGPFKLENIWVYITPSCGGSPVLPKFPPLIKISILDNSQNDTFDPGLINNLLSNPGGGE